MGEKPADIHRAAFDVISKLAAKLEKTSQKASKLSERQKTSGGDESNNFTFPWRLRQLSSLPLRLSRRFPDAQVQI